MPNNVLRLRKLWAGLTRPAYRRALRLGVGATIEHEAALAGLHFDTVVDVGANRGQFSTFARSALPECRIIAFEPLNGPATVFEKLFAHDARTRLVRTALGTTCGKLAMHVAVKDDSSSPLAIGEVQRSTFGTEERAQVEVSCGRLGDFLCDDDLGQRNLLKIDTQGYELEVMRGANDVLRRFTAIYCEVSFIELYAGQPLAGEVISYLYQNGFELAGIYNPTFATGLGQVQADMLFTKPLETCE